MTATLAQVIEKGIAPIQAFAEKHRLRTRLDGCGEKIVPGKKRSRDLPDRVEYDFHIYEHGPGRFGVCLLLPTRRRWTAAKRKLTAAGFIIRQNAETEGTALFDPENAQQAKVAVRLVGARKLRKAVQPSVAQEAARRLFSERARSKEGFPARGTSHDSGTTSLTSARFVSCGEGELPARFAARV